MREVSEEKQNQIKIWRKCARNAFCFALTVEAPTAKTTISVMEVTVIATPACFMVWPIFCGILFSCRSELFKLSKLCMITNMSSMPMHKRNEKFKWSYRQKHIPNSFCALKILLISFQCMPLAIFFNCQLSAKYGSSCLRRVAQQKCTTRKYWKYVVAKKWVK